MGNGLTRLQTRFLGEPDSVAAAQAAHRRARWTPRRPRRSAWSPQVFDEIDWDDEVRMLLEERASFSPDALTGMEANLRFAGPETMETRIFGRLTAWQNWIFQRANAVGETGALGRYGSGVKPDYDWRRTYRNEEGPMPDGMDVDYDGLIPNNVGLNEDARVRQALETWHPGYIDWWKDMGPEGFQDSSGLSAHRHRRRSEGLGEVRLT